MANQKLTQKELDQLQELSKKNAALVQELGTIFQQQIAVQQFVLLNQGCYHLVECV